MLEHVCGITVQIGVVTPKAIEVCVGGPTKRAPAFPHMAPASPAMPKYGNPKTRSAPIHPFTSVWEYDRTTTRKYSLREF